MRTTTVGCETSVVRSLLHLALITATVCRCRLTCRPTVRRQHSNDAHAALTDICCSRYILIDIMSAHVHTVDNQTRLQLEQLNSDKTAMTHQAALL